MPTPATSSPRRARESNVKEIYDKCAELSAGPGQRDLQPVRRVREPPRSLPVHRRGARPVFEQLSEQRARACGCAAFVSASGSAGTLGAGDQLKESYGAAIVAVEALECPTMLYNGFGEHNIQGIGDKHIPLIHNVLQHRHGHRRHRPGHRPARRALRTAGGLAYLRRPAHGSRRRRCRSGSFGLSSICNVLAAIKTAKHLRARAGRRDHDGRDRRSRACTRANASASSRARLPGRLRRRSAAAEAFGRWMLGAETDHLLETTSRTASGSSTSATSPGSSSRASRSTDFVAAAAAVLLARPRASSPSWDDLITEFNAHPSRGTRSPSPSR